MTEKMNRNDWAALARRATASGQIEHAWRFGRYACEALAADYGNATDRPRFRRTPVARI